MNRSILISAIVVVSLVSVVAAIYSSNDGDNTSTADQQGVTATTNQQTKEVASKPSTTKQQQTKARSSQPKPSQKQTVQKPAVKKSVARKSKVSNAAGNDSNTRVVRVRWPGMKHRMVRIVKEEKIEPATELRTWSRKQWVNKVKTLREADKDNLAEQYIAAYNKQYPKKDLNNYLK